MNHIVVCALIFVFGALVTLSAATAVHYWTIARQPLDESYNERTLGRPAYEYRKRSADCQTRDVAAGRLTAVQRQLPAALTPHAVWVQSPA